MKRLLLAILTITSALSVVSQSLTDSLETVAPDSITLSWPEYAGRGLDSLLAADKLMQTSQLGLMVYDLTADSALYCHGHRQTLRPASVMKLVTAIAGIDRLGGDYRFRTSLLYNGHIEGRTLVGDLKCVGGFDPRFNNDDLNAFVESIRQEGIDTICGSIFADLSMKDGDRLGEGWCWDDDNPVLSPLLLNRKDNFVCRLREELMGDGVVFVPDSVHHYVPSAPVHLCTRFHTLDQILMRMMKESDNLYAEAMFYQIAAAGGSRPAKASHARQVIRKLISKVGMSGSDYKIADGSGLSLYDYVTPELIVRLLRYAYQENNIFIHLQPSLPVGGEDGTLKKRLADPSTRGNVQAKTGTLTGVSSLAGYCTAGNGHQLCFCIINQGVMRASDGRAFQDKVCEILVKRYDW